MPRSRKIAMLLCCALVGGCGASDGSDSPKERFIADGDKHCSDLAKDAGQLRASRATNTPEDTLRNASTYRDLTRDLSTGLAKSAPSDDADAQRIVERSKRLASVARGQKVIAKRLVAAVRSGRIAAVRRDGLAFNRVALGTQRMIAEQLDRRMRAYGFENCGRRPAA